MKGKVIVMRICKVTSKSEIVTYNRKKYTKFNVEEQIKRLNGETGIVRYVVYQHGCCEYFPGDTVLITNGQFAVDVERQLAVICSQVITTRALETLKAAKAHTNK
jgi:hypothetical protein